jgi:hypothetical protein
MRHSAESNLKIEYLRDYEFIFETAFAHESGDSGVLLAEKKTEGRKSCENASLKPGLNRQPLPVPRIIR